jgi:hypothetical protein
VEILQGSDEYIGYGNPYGKYSNDGLNPCMGNEYYATYESDRFSADPPSWDYVILADQTKRVAVEGARQDTLSALSSVYAPLLNASGAIPVIVNTHAFWSSTTNMTGLDDIPTFTALINQGVDEYAETLSSLLPRSQRPIVAQVGLAFLTVWEEEYDLWEALFVADMMHSSVYGTYLVSCVLYMTVFGHRLPDSEAAHPENVPGLFYRSRKLVETKSVTYPSADEASYLRNVARRVALKGHIPSSFPII